MASPKSPSPSPASPLTTSSSGAAAPSRAPQIIVAAVTAAAALSAGVLYVVASGSGGAGSGGRGARRAFRSDATIAEPRQAVAEALEAIRGGRCQTCGELVSFLRGPPAQPVTPAVRSGTSGAAAMERKPPPSNAHCVRVPGPVLHYVQESFLPVARQQAAAARRVEYNMFAQVTASDVVLRALNVERATPFDKDNRAHVNLLQQLWMATGKPASAYNRLGPQWGSIGFQGEDPVTDLRGGGVLALRQLVHFAQVHNAAFREMLAYTERVQREGKHSWYLLAVVSIQLSTQLLLEQDHPFYLPHLEMLYDTVRLGPAADTSAKSVSRRSLAAQKQVSLATPAAAETAAFWDSCESSITAEAGLFALHHALLLHFKTCWERDEPHVMEYNTYMPTKVFGTFFTPQWTDAARTA